MAVEARRYTRQIILPEVGESGQQKLSNSSVLVVGAGGLGAPILLYLASAGIGRIGIVDCDSVSVSNLNRQVLYTESDVGKSKAHTASTRIQELNSTIIVDTYDIRLSEDNAISIATGYDLIVDACDNLSTRTLLDTVSLQLRIPYLYGAIEGFVGQMALFLPNSQVRYKDLFPGYDIKRDHIPIGVMGATAGALGGLMASQAIRYLLDIACPISSRLWRIDLATLGVDLIELST